MKLSLRIWQNTVKPQDDLIVQASTIEEEAADGWQQFPIGMGWHFVHNLYNGDALQLGTHENLVCCAVATNTDERRRAIGINRKSIMETLERAGITNTTLDHSVYFSMLPSYKFVISPEGNGIDCHRHYEALLAGAIPIMEKNPLIEEKYKGLPILWTTDYSEITKEYLEMKYNEMLDIDYDFSMLFVSSYDSATQAEIKRCGNYWIKRLLHIDWYN